MTLVIVCACVMIALLSVHNIILLSKNRELSNVLDDAIDSISEINRTMKDKQEG
jgi:hypothetical protein